MKPHFLIRLAIKLAALALYILLLFDLGTGQLFHELAGLAVFALVTTGILLDHRSLRELRRRYKDYTLSTLNSILLATETLVAIAVAILLITGLFNSSALFDRSLNATAYMLHAIAAYLLPLVMVVRLIAQLLQRYRQRKTDSKRD